MIEDLLQGISLQQVHEGIRGAPFTSTCVDRATTLIEHLPV
jgi:hypothetical protein